MSAARAVGGRRKRLRPGLFITEPRGGPPASPLAGQSPASPVSGTLPVSVLGRSAQAGEVPSTEVISPEPPRLAAVADPAATRSPADRAVTGAYRAHYGDLVRLAFLLTGDQAAAEDIVQDSYAGLHGAWAALGGQGAVLPFLRRTVIAGSRPEFPAAPRYAAGEQAQKPAAGVLPALRGLPGLQREALVLRLYLDLTDTEIAEAMQVSAGTARAHVTGALAALRGVA
jgi:DNA-directed RNA polymerase specialized sigma24 family protein